MSHKNRWGAYSIFILAAASLFSCLLEGYFPLISVTFWIFFGAVFLLSLWTSLSISTLRALSLIIFGFVIGYMTQMVGTLAGMWEYSRPTYFFAGFAWSFAAISMQGLSLLIKRIIKPIDDNILNLLAVTVIFAIIPLTLGEYRQQATLRFWLYYISLFGFDLVLTYRLNFSHLLSLILAAWAIGNLSEYLGSNSGLWSFTYNRGLAPLFLTFGCWPLEFLLQYGLADWICHDHLKRGENDIW